MGYQRALLRETHEREQEENKWNDPPDPCLSKSGKIKGIGSKYQSVTYHLTERGVKSTVFFFIDKFPLYNSGNPDSFPFQYILPEVSIIQVFSQKVTGE